MSTLEIIGIVAAGGGLSVGGLLAWIRHQAKHNPQRIANMVKKAPGMEAKMTAAAAENPDVLKQALRSNPDLANHPQLGEIDDAIDRLTPAQRARLLEDPSAWEQLTAGLAKSPALGAKKKDGHQKAKQKAARQARKRNRKR